MDTNFNDVISSVRFTLKKSSTLSTVIPKLREFLQKSNIRTVYIRSAQKADFVLKTARLLGNDFIIVLECDASGYKDLQKMLVEEDKNIALLPTYDIGGSITELKKITGLLPSTKTATRIFIKNDDKIRDKKKITKIFDNVMKVLGEKNVNFLWDCGFVLCSFSETQLGYFVQKGSDLTSWCPSFVNIDTNLDVRICDKLKQKDSITPNETLMKTIGTFGMALMPYNSMGVLKECISCPYIKKRACSGGCRAEIIKSFR